MNKKSFDNRISDDPRLRMHDPYAFSFITGINFFLLIKRSKQGDMIFYETIIGFVPLVFLFCALPLHVFKAYLYVQDIKIL